jgi:hypothetical protein
MNLEKILGKTLPVKNPNEFAPGYVIETYYNYYYNYYY